MTKRRAKARYNQDKKPVQLVWENLTWYMDTMSIAWKKLYSC